MPLVSRIEKSPGHFYEEWLSLPTEDGRRYKTLIRCGLGRIIDPGRILDFSVPLRLLRYTAEGVFVSSRIDCLGSFWIGGMHLPASAEGEVTGMYILPESAFDEKWRQEMRPEEVRTVESAMRNADAFFDAF